MRKLLKNKRGVTLVELLAVLVILGIIAAIAVPTIGNLIDNSRQRAAEAEWTNIQEAARLYATSEDPDAAFSLDAIEQAGYIDFDGTISGYETTATTGSSTDLLSEDIFDSNGDFDSALLPTGVNTIFIDGYQVYPAL